MSTEKESPKAPNRDARLILPPSDAHIALVRCGETRCMAYREKQDRKWRDYFHHDEIAGEVQVICYL